MSILDGKAIPKPLLKCYKTTEQTSSDILSNDREKVIGVIKVSEGGRYLRTNGFKTPSGITLYADAASGSRLTGHHFFHTTSVLASNGWGIWRIHNDRANVAFVDGHVESLDRGGLYNTPMQVYFSYNKLHVREDGI